MQFILKFRSTHVLIELLAVAALVACAWLGAGCGGSGDGVIRISAPEAVDNGAWGAGSVGKKPSAVKASGAKKAGGAKKTTGRKVKKKPVTLRQVVARYKRHVRSLKGLTPARLSALHPRRYLKRHGLKVSKAEFYRGFVKAFRLSGAARRTLGKRGFVVVPGGRIAIGKSKRNRGQGPSNLYYRVFDKNLPVYVSADSILHAWHRSYDNLVLDLEQHVLQPVLRRMLKRTLAELDLATVAGRDAYVYLGVAMSLLSNTQFSLSNNVWRPKHGTAGVIRRITKALQGNRVVRIPLCGRSERVDARRYHPRGRYARKWHMTPFFQALTWLSQVELRLHSGRTGARADRQEAAARALVAAMKAGKGLKDHAQLERTYGLLLGRPMAVTPVTLLALCARAGLKDCRGQGRDMMRRYAALSSPAYSPQIYAGDRGAVRLSLLPRRFAYDVWVTSRTTTPGLPPRRSFGRSMARDFDIAFALGSDRALDRIAPELGLRHRKHLPVALEAARRTLRDLPPTRVSGAVYSHWLEAIMALARTDLSPKLPRVLRTAAWQDRKMEASLGALVELRQDAGPLVEPSYGGEGCQYPKGYVEPIPALYGALKGAAGRLEKAFPKTKRYSGVRSFFAHWRKTLARLTRLAGLQLAGKPMSKSDLRFLSHIVDRHQGTYWGVRRYDGWYPKLYWGAHFSIGGSGGRGRGTNYGGSLSKLALATLHVDVDNRKVLQAATAHPGLMVVAIDVGGKTALYGGPVYSYHRFQRSLKKPLSDHEWEVRVTSSNPARPRFVRAYHAR